MLFRSTNSNQNELKISFLRFWKKLKYKNEIMSNSSKCFGVCYHMIFIRSCIYVFFGKHLLFIKPTHIADLQTFRIQWKNKEIFLSPLLKLSTKMQLILMARPLLALLQSGFPSIKGNLSFWAVKFYSERTCLYMSRSLRKRYNYVDRIYLMPTQLLEVWTHLYVSEIKSEGNCNSSGYYTKVNLNMYKELDSLLNLKDLISRNNSVLRNFTPLCLFLSR